MEEFSRKTLKLAVFNKKTKSDVVHSFYYWMCIILILFWFIILIIPVVDFFIKNAVEKNLGETTEFSTILPFLKIVNVKNFGSAFGMLGRHPQFLLFFTFAVISGLLTMVFVKKIKDVKLLIAISFIIGGGIGNLVDRVLRGYVVDYLKVTFFPPVCNLSDYLICLGVGLLAIYMFRNQT